ncbi:flavodoxin/nitric oxide synthase [Thermosulfidibacter takaii ABI70S6]|uniref:Flavodoxin/nitric oxide synthase n=1 Tax=Thermosulfidibacter takaii (strain DSM 17441 / JCM 13301 / NBRC 103674 / ABI70S6) TaxID=1298851 RepID=A0A0S3QS50_THET7|nr:FprA family A-type flavoprotein [Thermosulfidibacter takaii]BAT71145.1 flavodoxin/nitric oxide synthase [Thermosulfidibacter takaii ABI70S6]
MEVSSFKAVPITKDVYWVGAIDWSLRNFHGYTTHKGSTYNAYLILADKIVLIDTVKKQYKDEMLARISSVVDLKKIDYIVSNHAEMDHSGALPEVIEIVKPEKVFASIMGVKNLTGQLHLDTEIVAVKDGDELDIGGKKLKFFETRMLHWPDSMFTYVVDDGILFSQDAFGMHYATRSIFVDECPKATVEHELITYYANILMPYSGLVLNLFKKLEGLDIKIIAPDHGPIFRREEDIKWLLGLYRDMAEQKPNNRAVVVYDTMWGSTDKMARAIADGIAYGGSEVVILPISGSHRSDVATETLKAGALVVGSPTINNNMFPSVADILTYLRGLRPKNLIGVAFGSYGWSGEAVKQIKEYFDAMGVELVGEMKIQWVPTEEQLRECCNLGVEISKRLKELAGQ